MIQITEEQFITMINESLRLICNFYEFDNKRNEVQNEFMNLISKIKYNISFIKSVLENNPDFSINNNEFNYYSKYFLEKYDNEDDPIDKLLSWGTMSNPDRSFILDESYDILGKEDARSLQHYLRQVILKYAPHKANF